MSDAEQPWPDVLNVVIEVPRLGFIKRRDDGGVDFISPLPCPFNYGSVPGTLSGDGDRADAVVLGARLARGTEVRARVVARVSFTDAGLDDPKCICVPEGTPFEGISDLNGVTTFFRFYARAKTLLNALRGKRGATSYGGVELKPDQASA